MLLENGLLNEKKMHTKNIYIDSVIETGIEILKNDFLHVTSRYILSSNIFSTCFQNDIS